MNFVILFIFFFIGLLIASFTLLQVFIILFFGIPTTRMVEKLGYLKKNNNIIKNYLISIIILTSVYVVLALLVKNFFPQGFIGFVIGLVATLLLGLGKVGRNKDNISDFVETNKEKFTEHPGKVIEAILIK